MPAPGIDPAKVARVHDEELKKFAGARPRTMALLERARAHMPNGVPMAWMATDNEVPVHADRGEGAGFVDVDGHRYLDVNVADMSMFCGYAHPAIVDAVAERARAGTQFLQAHALIHGGAPIGDPRVSPGGRAGSSPGGSSRTATRRPRQ